MKDCLSLSWGGTQAQKKFGQKRLTVKKKGLSVSLVLFEVPDSRGVLNLARSIKGDAFSTEKRPLAFNLRTVRLPLESADRQIRSDDTMARHLRGKRIIAERAPYCLG
jgi:hypothetical protein